MASTRQLKICEKGHRFYKTSDCPVCPVCASEQKPKSGFLSKISAPAQRALENNGITSLKKLSTYSEKEVLRLHGMGPSSIPTLKKALQEEYLKFKQ